MSKAIKTEEQYNDVLARVYELMQVVNEDDSKVSAELEALSLLVKDYELVHYPMPSSNL